MNAPRNRKRKPQKKRIKINFARIGRGVLLLLIAIGVTASGRWVQQRVTAPDLLPIREVVLDGYFRQLNQLDVREAVASAIDGGFLKVDVRKVQSAVKALPWVRTAGVRRIWPGTLVIRVSEHTPAARWGDDGLISSEGVIFRPPTVDGFESLPLMEASDEYKDDVLVQVNLVNRLLGAVGPINHVKRNAMGGWTFWVVSGLRIELGVSEVLARLERVKYFIRRFESELNSVELIDARYTNGVAVRLKPQDVEENNSGESLS